MIRSKSKCFSEYTHMHMHQFGTRPSYEYESSLIQSESITIEETYGEQKKPEM
jgi:hypothetical protein